MARRTLLAALALAILAMFTLGVATVPTGADPAVPWKGTLSDVSCLPEDFTIVGTKKSTYVDMVEWNHTNLQTTTGRGTATGAETGTTWSVVLHSVHFNTEPDIFPDTYGAMTRWLLRRDAPPGELRMISVLRTAAQDDDTGYLCKMRREPPT